jgi:hypothetical protein
MRSESTELSHYETSDEYHTKGENRFFIFDWGYPSMELQEAASRLVTNTIARKNTLESNLAFFDEIDRSRGFNSKGSESQDGLVAVAGIGSTDSIDSYRRIADKTIELDKITLMETTPIKKLQPDSGEGAVHTDIVRTDTESTVMVTNAQLNIATPPIYHKNSFIKRRTSSEGEKALGPEAFFSRHNTSILMTRSMGDRWGPRGCIGNVLFTINLLHKYIHFLC